MGLSPAKNIAGDGDTEFRYAELMGRLYTGTLLGSVNDNDWDSTKHICDLIYSTDRLPNNSDPKCLRLTEIVESRKYIISVCVSNNAASGDSKDATPSWYISKKAGEYEQRTGGAVDNIYKPDGWLRR